jgi:hypothetical protein
MYGISLMLPLLSSLHCLLEHTKGDVYRPEELSTRYVFRFTFLLFTSHHGA